MRKVHWKLSGYETADRGGGWAGLKWTALALFEEAAATHLLHERQPGPALASV